MANRIMGRRVKVRAGVEGEPSRVWEGGAPGQLRIAFDLEKAIGGDPNQGTITIYNQAEPSRAFLSDAEVVIVDAGYEDGVDQLWRGYITDVIHRLDNNTWISQIETLDGKRELERPVNISFGEGASVGQVAGGIIERFKEGGATGFLSEAIEQGSAAVTGLLSGGTMREELDRITGAAGLEYSIQDGSLIIADPDGGTDEAVVHITPETGLIGSPDRGSDGLVVLSKLNGKLRPHRRFVLRSQYVQGVYVVRRARHVGDTYGSAWETTLEADG